MGDRTDDISVLSFYKKIPLFSEGSDRMEGLYSHFISNINSLGSQSYLGRGEQKYPSGQVREDSRIFV
jgi:hypothetical protein